MQCQSRLEASQPLTSPATSLAKGGSWKASPRCLWISASGLLSSSHPCPLERHQTRTSLPLMSNLGQNSSVSIVSKTKSLTPNIPEEGRFYWRFQGRGRRGLYSGTIGTVTLKRPFGQAMTMGFHWLCLILALSFPASSSTFSPFLLAFPYPSMMQLTPQPLNLDHVQHPSPWQDLPSSQTW